MWSSISSLPRRVLSYGLCAAYTAFITMPLLWLVVMSLKTNYEITARPYALPKTWEFAHYADVWLDGGFNVYFTNSAVVVTTSILVIVVLAAMAAYAFAKHKFHSSETLYIIVFSAIMIPLQIVIIPIAQMFAQYHLSGTRTSLILIYIATQLPLSIHVLRGFFEQIPDALADSGRIDGASEWTLFWRVMFPIAKPAIATVIIFNFIFLWNEFLLANVFIRETHLRTVPLGLMQYFGLFFLDFAHLATASVMSALPILVIYAILSEQFIKGMTAGALKG